MEKKNNSQIVDLTKRLVEIAEEYRKLQKEFRAINKRAKDAFVGAISRRDSEEIAKLRKNLALN